LIEPHWWASIKANHVMSHRAIPRSKAGCIAQRQPHKRARARNGLFNRPSLPQPARDGTRESAAGSVRVRRYDSPFRPARNFAIWANKAISDDVTLAMSALNKDDLARRSQNIFAAKSCQLGQIGRDQRRQRHQPPRRNDCFIVGQGGTARRDHNWVDYEWKIGAFNPQWGKLVGDRVGNRGRSDHPNLDRINPNVPDNRIDLGTHAVRRREQNIGNPARILGRQRGNRGHCITTEHGDRFEIRLNASTSARI
jgi:hypothetical protein